MKSFKQLRESKPSTEDSDINEVNNGLGSFVSQMKLLLKDPKAKKAHSAASSLIMRAQEKGAMAKTAVSAIKKALPGLAKKAGGKWEKKILGMKTMMIESVELEEVFSQAQMKKAIGIARKSTGNYDKAYAEIEKIKKGLGDEHIVANALKKANESVEEAVTVDMRTKGYKEAIARSLLKASKNVKKSEIEEIIDAANKHIMGENEGMTAAGSDATGAVDGYDKPLGKTKKRKSFKESVELDEGVSSEAKAVMKEINKNLKILKTELKTSDENQDWKARLNRIEGIIGKVKWTVDEAITEANGSDCTIQNDGRNNIAVCIDGLSFADARKGTRGAMMNITDFKKKAKVAYADSKGKPTIPAVKKEIKALGAKNFYAKWQADSSSYKDDSVQIWFTK